MKRAIAVFAFAVASLSVPLLAENKGVEVRELGPVRGVLLRKTGDVADAPKAVSELQEYLKASNAKVSGKPLLLMLDDPAKVAAGKQRWAVLVPVVEPFEAKLPFVFGEAPPANYAVARTEGSIAEASKNVAAWAHDNHWTATPGPIVYAFLDGKDKAEIRLPVTKVERPVP